MKKNFSLADILIPLCLLTGLWLAVRPGLVVAQVTFDHVVYMPYVGRPSGSQSTDFVRMPKDAYLRVAEQIQVKRLFDYDSFVWLEIDIASLSVLDDAGVPYELQQEAFVLLLNRFQFDPLEGEPDIPPTQRTSYDPGEEGFYLVQFFGPVLDAWLEQLAGAGAQVIQFQPSFAYIVRMTPEEADVVSSLEFVRWVGVYHAAYRIAPSLLEPPPPVPEALEQLIENVDVTIFNDGQVEETLVAIRGLGGQIIQTYPATPDGSLVTAILALPFENVVSVAQLNSVLWMNRSSPRPGFDDEVSDQIVVGNHAAGVPFTGYNAWLAGNGLDGSGVTVAVVDTGMDTNNNATAHLDIRGRIAAFVAYAGAPATDTDGHGTHVGGVVAGNATIGTTDANGFLYGEGVAPNAQLVVQNALVGAAWPPAGGWQQLSQDSVNNGAVASNNSWFTGAAGAQGYSAPARTHDIMVRDADFTTAGMAEPLIMVFSAGNSGPGASTITEPKEAKNLISVGAAENFRNDPFVMPIGCGTPNNINNMANFSSRGPSLDGRILPNVTAPGTFIASLRSATGAFGGGSCSGIIDANYVWFSGTSQASPHVTGGVALITEWWRNFNAGANPSPAMAKALLINGAVDMDTADIPNNNEGWGRVNLTNVVDPGVPVIYQDQTASFGASGQAWELAVGPFDPTLPLKVTLVWSDAPGAGSGGATASWVNDLDLTLSQGATLFRGNVFTNGWSTTGGAADAINNVENVYIQNPSGGYLITVDAANIAGDGVPISGDMTDQDFALVCYNCIPAADVSVSKSDSPDPVAAGATLSYTVDVTNDGPAEAENVVLTDILPAGVSFVSSVPGSPTCTEAAGTVTCNLGNISSGDTSQVTIDVMVDADLVFNNGGPLVINNQASVSSTTPDSDLDNNETTEDTLVVAVADLEIVSFEAVDPPAEILIGEDVDIAFEKVITNNGPSAPMDTELTLTATASPGASVTPGLLVFPELALDLNDMRLVEEVFTVSCEEPGAHTFTFTNEIQPLDAADTDPDQTNNTAEVNLEIECVVPVKINIKPGSFPNSINLGNMGVIPVGVLTTEAGEYGLPLAFDATSIDPLSVRFGPEEAVWDETGGAFEAHDRGHIEDTFELDEVTKDGDDDMVLHFRTQETGIASDDTEACVKGEFVAEDDSVFEFFGCDSIRIVPPH